MLYGHRVADLDRAVRSWRTCIASNAHKLWVAPGSERSEQQVVERPSVIARIGRELSADTLDIIGCLDRWRPRGRDASAECARNGISAAGFGVAQAQRRRHQLKAFGYHPHTEV
jgi:hypothetical protein